MIRLDVQAIRENETMAMSQMTNAYTAIECMDRLFLSLVIAVLNYVEAFELQ